MLERIHATLPQPSPELAAAKSSTEYVAELKKIPRNQRKAIYIDQMETLYAPDTGQAFAAGSAAGGGSERRSEDPGRGGPSAPTVGSGPKGFLVILKGRTPYGAGQPQAVVFVSEWVKSLKDVHGQEVQFYVDRVDESPKVLPISNPGGAGGSVLGTTWAPADALSVQGGRRAPLLTAGGARPDSGGGEDSSRRGGGYEDPRRRGGGGEDPSRGVSGGGGAGGGNMGAAATAALDPLTEEPTSGDWVFQVKMTVIPGQVSSAAPAAPQENVAQPVRRRVD